jgi:membrane protease YdiL (CAAX protease family)
MPYHRDQSDGFPMAVLVEGGLALAAAFLAWVLNVPLRDQFPAWGLPLAIAAGRGVLAALPMLVVFWVLVHSKQRAMRQLRHQVESLIREMFPAGNAAQFALIAVLAGVGEELLFRGVVQTKLSEWISPGAGVVLGGFLFGAAHALSRLYFLLATVIGVYLGWFVQSYGELVTPIVAHALYDFLALMYLSRLSRSHHRRWTDPPGDEDRAPPA